MSCDQEQEVTASLQVEGLLGVSPGEAPCVGASLSGGMKPALHGRRVCDLRDFNLRCPLLPK